MAEPKDIISIAILKQKSSIQVALKAAFYYFFTPKNTVVVNFLFQNNPIPSFLQRCYNKSREMVVNF